MMPQFKKGDIVILVNSNGMSALKGAKALVTRENYFDRKYEDEFIDIKWIDEKSNTQMNGGYCPDHFELCNRIQITENSTELERWLNLLDD